MKEEAKMVYLLECLQKTPPPVSSSPAASLVLILCSDKNGGIPGLSCYLLKQKLLEKPQSAVFFGVKYFFY